MTVPPAASAARPRPWWADRSWLLVLTPLVGVAWLPWWCVLGLVLALAVTHREGSEARSVQVPLLLLGGGLGLAVLLPGMRGAEGALLFSVLFGKVVGGILLVVLSLSALEGGALVLGAAWLSLLLLLGCVLPGGASPAGLAAGLLVLLLALAGAPSTESRPFLRLAGSGRALLGVVGTALLAAALLGVLALPLASAPAAGPPPAASAAGREARTRPAEAAPLDLPERSTLPGRAQPQSLPTSVRREALPGADLALLGGLLLILALTYLYLRGRAERWRAGERPRWWELLALAGVLMMAGLFVAYVFAAPGGGTASGLPGGDLGAAGAGGGKPQDPRASLLPTRADAILRALSVLAFVILTALAGAVFWLAWRTRGDTPQADAAAPTPDAAPGEEGALHRVRQAYRAALASLSGAGLGRGGAETPAEHAGRAARELPVLAGPLGTLVAAYAPVRYGGRVTDEDADAAERAAREVAHLTAGVRVNTGRTGEPESQTSEHQTPESETP
ncbi:hypothetical protein Dcar01_00090 [Deinococcus carri]|uniref:Protein-glutamine gamma-glutamyltransferase-like C-terminal domain-containing protein n=1 Tax=Deinococcus carri TaxID=1211323 RepID=A0ABP9W1Y8_9DEIO